MKNRFQDCQTIEEAKSIFRAAAHSTPFEKRINRFGIRMNSYSSASLWDGKEEYYKSWYA